MPCFNWYIDSPPTLGEDGWPINLSPEPTTSEPFYDEWFYLENCWPANEQCAQPDHRAALSYDNPPTSNGSSEVPETTPAPSDNWEGYESGEISDTEYEDPQTPYEPSVRSTMTGSMERDRCQPHAPSRAYPNEHANAEAGPSNLAAPPPANPSGGTSEASADAENSNTETEENAAPPRRPRGSGELRPTRIRHQAQLGRLCKWAQKWEGLPKLPTQRRALATALEVVETLRQPLPSDGSSFGRFGDRQGGKGKKRSMEAVRESRRRDGLEGLFKELGKFYEVPGSSLTWRYPKLLVRVLEDVEHLQKPPATSST